MARPVASETTVCSNGLKTKTCSQYTNLVKISQKQYGCIKRNFKSSLVFYSVWHGAFVYKPERNDTVLQRQFSAMLWAWSLGHWECLCVFVLLVDSGKLGILQQHAECPLRKCWSTVVLSFMKWSSMQLWIFFLHPAATPRCLWIVGLLQCPLCILFGFDTVLYGSWAQESEFFNLSHWFRWSFRFSGLFCCVNREIFRSYT